MADKRLKADATYINKTDKEINDFRDDLFAEMGTKNVSGYMVGAEGNTWIELEGDEFDVDHVCNFIDTYGLFATFTVGSVTTITSRKLSERYIYYEDKAPVTSP